MTYGMPRTAEDRIQRERFCKAVQHHYSVLSELVSGREEIRRRLIEFCRTCKDDCLGNTDCDVRKAYHAIF